MKKLLTIASCVACALALTISALAQEKKEPTEEQKKLQKELLEKYDTNKDGKLDKEERSKMTPEDQDKARKAGMGGGKKKKDA